MAKQCFYVTTTLPYVNATPHIGFALEIVEADVIARFQRLIKDPGLDEQQVIFNTGTDEHGQKIYQKALEANQEPQQYVDESAAKFAQLKELLNLSFNHFIRTTDPKHIKAAQKFWQLCDQNGDIYQKDYQIKYCVGCELEKTDSELDNGRCPLHPNRELEVRQEENYFFRFSKYQDQLLKLYRENPQFVKPAGKQKEITAFVEAGLKDFSISRLKEKMPWGIAVPGDKAQVMYVWFDALINYISTLGWPDDQENFHKFWPGIQLAGKDNLRQQAAMWQAMLMSAGIPNSKQILINGFINVNGQKMSKSLGNVIHPREMVDKFGVDATRYLLISLGTFSQDIDVTWERLKEKYAADLAHGLGNLCSRVAKLCAQTNLVAAQKSAKLDEEYLLLQHSYDLTDALNWIIDQVKTTDLYLSQTKPWKKSGQTQKEILTKAITRILKIAHHLSPFMPDTASEITAHFTQKKIQALKPLFPPVS